MIILPATNYQVEIGSLESSSFSSFIQNKYADSKIIIMVDENTNDYCLEYMITTFEFLADAEVMLLPVGEENKVMEVCFQVWEALSEYNIGRKDLIINLGGGVVTDMGGFIASIYKRGIDFIHIPTTLLAMIDASIGGKTGIDLGMHKNQLGVFQDPVAIYVDKSFLETLEPREMVNGFAEALKHALVKDANLWKRLKGIDNLKEIVDDERLAEIIQIKQRIVNEDAKESGLRKILNFGHTIGHAMEGYFLFKDPIDHGHAVAIGMICEAFISMRKGCLSAEEFQEIEQLLLGWFPVPPIKMKDIDGIIELMRHDKKNHSGAIQSCLLTGIGSCTYDNVVEESICAESLMYLVSRTASKN